MTYTKRGHQNIKWRGRAADRSENCYLSNWQSRPPWSPCRVGDLSERDGQGRLALKQPQTKYLNAKEIGTEPLKILREGGEHTAWSENRRREWYSKTRAECWLTSSNPWTVNLILHFWELASKTLHIAPKIHIGDCTSQMLSTLGTTRGRFACWVWTQRGRGMIWWVRSQGLSTSDNTRLFESSVPQYKTTLNKRCSYESEHNLALYN